MPAVQLATRGTKKIRWERRAGQHECWEPSPDGYGYYKIGGYYLTEDKQHYSAIRCPWNKPSEARKFPATQRSVVRAWIQEAARA